VARASAELVDWIDDNGRISGICGKKKEEIENVCIFSPQRE